MGGGVGEAGDLRVLGDEIADRVVDEVDERVPSGYMRRRHVADRHRDVGGLLPEALGHRLRELDARDRDSALVQGDRDPPGPDRELDGASPAAASARKAVVAVRSAGANIGSSASS